MLYILHGANRFDSAARLRELRTALDPDGFLGISFDDPDLTIDALRAACDVLPFFGNNRVVDLRGTLTRWHDRQRGAAGTSPAANNDSDPVAALVSYLPLLPPTTTLIFWEPGLLELAATLRSMIADLGSAAAIERFDVPLGNELRAWVIGRARVADATLRPDAADALLDALCPQGWREAPRGRDATLPDPQQIDTEIQKLATAIIDRDPPLITTRVVAALTAGETETNIFQLVDAVTVGNTRRALALLRSGLDEGLAPELIISLLATRFGQLARLRALGGTPVAGAVAGKLGVTPYRARELGRQLSQIGPDRLSSCLGIMLTADEATKTGRAPRSEDALYRAVLDLCQL